MAPTEREPDVSKEQFPVLSILSPDTVLKAAIEAKPRSALAAQLGGSKSSDLPTAKREKTRKLSPRQTMHKPISGSAAVALANQPGHGPPIGSSVEGDDEVLGVSKEPPEAMEEAPSTKSAPGSVSQGNVETPSSEGLAHAAAAAIGSTDKDVKLKQQPELSKEGLAGPDVDPAPKSKSTLKKAISKKFSSSSKDTAPGPGRL